MALVPLGQKGAQVAELIHLCSISPSAASSALVAAMPSPRDLYLLLFLIIFGTVTDFHSPSQAGEYLQVLEESLWLFLFCLIQRKNPFEQFVFCSSSQNIPRTFTKKKEFWQAFSLYLLKAGGG